MALGHAPMDGGPAVVDGDQRSGRLGAAYRRNGSQDGSNGLNGHDARDGGTRRRDGQSVDDPRIQALETEVAQLRLALATQRQIALATGLVAQRLGCTTDDAWQQLVRVSQTSNMKLRVVARVLCEAFDGHGAVEDQPLLAGLWSGLKGRPSRSRTVRLR